MARQMKQTGGKRNAKKNKYGVLPGKRLKTPGEFPKRKINAVLVDFHQNFEHTLANARRLGEKHGSKDVNPSSLYSTMGRHIDKHADLLKLKEQQNMALVMVRLDGFTRRHHIELEKSFKAGRTNDQRLPGRLNLSQRQVESWVRLRKDFGALTDFETFLKNPDFGTSPRLQKKNFKNWQRKILEKAFLGRVDFEKNMGKLMKDTGETNDRIRNWRRHRNDAAQATLSHANHSPSAGTPRGGSPRSHQNTPCSVRTNNEDDREDDIESEAESNPDNILRPDEIKQEIMEEDE